MMQRPLIVGFIGLALIVLGTIAAWLTMPQDDPAKQAAQPGRPPAAASTASGAAGAGTSNNSPAPARAPAAEPAVPSFDVVRVNPSGDTVIAGRGAPNATVRILDGGVEIGSVIADGRGEWVFVPTSPLPPGPRELSLSSTVNGKELHSEQVVTLVVPERGSNAPALVVASPRSGGPSRVLQGPGITAGQLSLDIVDYDNDGNVVLGGHAPAGAVVQVYLDNKPIGRSVADADGRWQLTPTGKVAAGQYMLRLDQMSPDGKVAMRIEAPFVRSEFGPQDMLPGRVVVQPGESLWRIARRVHGRGMAYVTIYDSNREQIRDPDLIYPGQVFSLSRTN